MDNFTEHWTEYVDPDDLQNQYEINYVEDGWYTCRYTHSEDWAYVVEEDEQFFITVWENDPRPQLKKMLEAAVR